MTPASLSTLGRDLLRPLVTLVSPGALLLAPYAQMLLESNDPIRVFTVRHVGASVAGFLLAAVAVGLLLENIGALIEEQAWDRILHVRDRKKRHRIDGFNHDWHQYWLLRFPATEEPVGMHYIRTMVVQMKGELAFALALVGGIYGAVQVGASAGLSAGRIALGVILTTVLAAYLMCESFSSAGVLADVRRELVHEYRPRSQGSARRRRTSSKSSQ